MNEIEQEAIILNAACHLIDDMLNHGMVVEEWSPDWSNIMFRTDVHSRLFNILLGDFLSIPNPKKGDVVARTQVVLVIGCSTSDLDT